MRTWPPPPPPASAGLLGWLLLGDLVAGDGAGARRRAWQFALVMAVLINVKQVGLVLFVVVSAGVVVAAARDPAVGAAKFLRLVPVMALPALILYGLWRYHVSGHMSDWSGTEVQLRPFAEWSFHLIPGIVKQMAVVAAKKSLYFAIMAVAVGFALRALFRFGGPFDRLALIVGTALLGYNGFLLLIYVASFGEADALRAVSYWRYNMHGGMLAIAFAAYALGLLWKKYLASRLEPRSLAWVPVALALAAPLVFAPKLRFDLEPNKPHYRAVALDLALPAGRPPLPTRPERHGRGRGDHPLSARSPDRALARGLPRQQPFRRDPVRLRCRAWRDDRRSLGHARSAPGTRPRVRRRRVLPGGPGPGALANHPLMALSRGGAGRLTRPRASGSRGKPLISVRDSSNDSQDRRHRPRLRGSPPGLGTVTQLPRPPASTRTWAGWRK